MMSSGYVQMEAFAARYFEANVHFGVGALGIYIGSLRASGNSAFRCKNGE
jgi:hypothetical protein